MRFLILFFFLTFPAFAQPVAVPREAAAAMVAAVEARDADAVAALYTAEAIVLSPGQPPVAGRDAIRDAWARNFAAGYSRLEVDQVRTETGADRAAMLFTWQATIAQPGRDPMTLRGRSLLYLIRQDAGWLISADSWHQVP